MCEHVFELLKTRKYILQGLAFLVFFMVIYTMLDGFNMSYTQMRETYGSGLVITNISLNFLMAFLTALLLNMSTANAALKGGKDTKGSNLGFSSVLFGVLTYGCTPCVIAFFGSLGIAFSVIALPFAGLPYKLLSLALIIVGLVWTRHEIRTSTCTI
ncbi:MAG: hypothetical protein KGZ38_01075 [Erysipelothrix sp.]|jgi:hypothetical protein|nr:hypothetical protein [Erysipelothrix sp.]